LSREFSTENRGPEDRDLWQSLLRTSRQFNNEDAESARIREIKKSAVHPMICARVITTTSQAKE